MNSKNNCMNTMSLLRGFIQSRHFEQQHSLNLVALQQNTAHDISRPEFEKTAMVGLG